MVNKAQHHSLTDNFHFILLLFYLSSLDLIEKGLSNMIVEAQPIDMYSKRTNCGLNKINYFYIPTVKRKTTGQATQFKL